MKTLINISFTLLLSGIPNLIYAQEIASSLEERSWLNDLTQTKNGQLLLVIGSMLIILIIFLIVIAILLAKTANIILGKVEKDAVSWTTKLKQRWITGKLKPVGEEGDMLLDHNYDGIQEMDYGMPPWLRYIFIGTFIFAVFYVPAYLVYDIIPDQETELAEEYQHAALMAEARAKAGIMAITAETAELSTDESVIAAGNAIFQKSCSVCHAKDGGGGVGPNLTDEFWLHGSDIKGVFKTVSEGVPSKGMIPWKGKLNPKDIQDVSNYILSLVGTVPANPKEPQGEFIQSLREHEPVDVSIEDTTIEATNINTTKAN